MKNIVITIVVVMVTIVFLFCLFVKEQEIEKFFFTKMLYSGASRGKYKSDLFLIKYKFKKNR